MFAVMLFLCFVCAVTFHQLIKVNQVTIKVWAINTCKFDFAANVNTAAAAHASTIDHDWVEGYDGLDCLWSGYFRNKLHHWNWTDCDNCIVLSAFIDQLLKFNGYKTFFAVCAVIGHNVEVVCNCAHFVLDDNDIFGTETSDHINMSAHSMQCFCLWVCDCTTYTTADYADIFESFQMGWDSQRTNNVLQVFACFHSAKHFGRTTNHLNNQSDGAFFSVIICNGQRNALALFVDAEDNKLTWENFFSNKRSFYFYENNCFV